MTIKIKHRSINATNLVKFFAEGKMSENTPDSPEAMMAQIKKLWKRNEDLLEDRRKLLIEIKELNFGLKRCHDRLDALKKIVNWEDKDELPRTDKGDSEV